MDESDIIEAWHERAAIREFLGVQPATEKLAGRDWRRDCERAAYFEIKKLHKIDKMPDETAGWMRSKH